MCLLNILYFYEIITFLRCSCMEFVELSFHNNGSFIVVPIKKNNELFRQFKCVTVLLDTRSETDKEFYLNYVTLGYWYFCLMKKLKNVNGNRKYMKFLNIFVRIFL